MIKPEDVPRELLELAMEHFEGAYWNDVTAGQVACFLAYAVETGIVSDRRHADIVRRLAEWHVQETDDIRVIVADAAALWAEITQEGGEE